MTTTRLIDHRHRRTWRLTEFFGNDTSIRESGSVFMAPFVLTVFYAGVGQFWWFLGLEATLLAIVPAVLLFFSYVVAVNRAKLDWFDTGDGARALQHVQEIQRTRQRLPVELQAGLDDTLLHCYRALKVGLSEEELLNLAAERRDAAYLLWRAYTDSAAARLEESDDLDKLKELTKALRETSRA